MVLLTGTLALVGAGPIVAQEPRPEISDSPGASARWELGGAFLLARPLGEFGRYVDGGAGLGISGVRYFGGARRWGVRADLTLVSYGKASTTAELILAGAAVDVDVTTENAIASFAIGPQYVFGQGRVRPWMNASIGSAQFVTTTSVWAEDRPLPIARTDVLERHALALTAGGGARVALWPRRRRPVSLAAIGFR